MNKLYYTIGEVSEMLSEESTTIRFWSNHFAKYIHPERNAKGNRLYHEGDVKNLKLIRHLIREQGVTLEGVIKKFESNKEGLDERMKIIGKLEGIKTMLEELRDNL